MQDGLLLKLTDIEKSGLKTKITLDRLTSTRRLLKCFVNRSLPVMNVTDFLEVDSRLMKSQEDCSELVRFFYFYWKDQLI